MLSAWRQSRLSMDLQRVYEVFLAFFSTKNQSLFRWYYILQVFWISINRAAYHQEGTFVYQLSYSLQWILLLLSQPQFKQVLDAILMFNTTDDFPH